jgi:hypothetical protein
LTLCGIETHGIVLDENTEEMRLPDEHVMQAPTLMHRHNHHVSLTGSSASQASVIEPAGKGGEGSRRAARDQRHVSSADTGDRNIFAFRTATTVAPASNSPVDGPDESVAVSADAPGIKPGQNFIDP